MSADRSIHSLMFILIVLISTMFSKSWMLCSWSSSQSNCWLHVFILLSWFFVARMIVENSWRLSWDASSESCRVLSDSCTAILSQYRVSEIRDDRESQTTLLWKQHRDRNRELVHTIQLRERFVLRVCIWSTINERC
jgi:hypothetical protein